MQTDKNRTRRLPAEWEEQDGVLLAWPHPESDWEPLLAKVEPMFVAIVAAISRFEDVILVAADKDAALTALQNAGVDTGRVTIAQVPTNDTWARDFGPITVYESNTPLHLNFSFNGWGGKFRSELDNAVNRRLAELGHLHQRVITLSMVLEGGSIESDGNSTLLVTGRCLLNRNRNPQLTKSQIERLLIEEFGLSRILWLNHGYLAGDDTDAHVDTLARLCPGDTIVHVSCSDQTDEHYAELTRMEAELQAFRTADGRPYRLLPLPLPTASYGHDGERLPATYANFLVINGAVLVPTYDDPQDEQAIAIIGQAFPTREIIGIDCRAAILQHGSLHCLTMQLPKGTIS